MVNYYSEQVDRVFYALSNATRRRILAQLYRQDMLVKEIAANYDISLPGISKHLRVLAQAGLISQKKLGRERYCSARPQSLSVVAGLIQHYTQFWDQSFNRLEPLLKTKGPSHDN